MVLKTPWGSLVLSDDSSVYCGSYGMLNFDDTDAGTCESQSETRSTTTDATGKKCVYVSISASCQTSSLNCFDLLSPPSPPPSELSTAGR